MLKGINEFFTIFWPKRKSWWGAALCPSAVFYLFVQYASPWYSTNFNYFLYASIAAIISVGIGHCAWLIHSGRFLFPSEKYTVVLILKAKDAMACRHRDDAIELLRQRLDSLGLQDKFRIIIAGEDIFKNREGAHAYRSRVDADLVIWGTAQSGKKEDKDVSDFGSLSFTFKIPLPLRGKKEAELFQKDIGLILLDRDWNVWQMESIKHTARFAQHIFESIEFIIGASYGMSEEHAHDAIVLMENLLQSLTEKTAGEKVDIDKEKKTAHMSARMGQRCRVVAVLLAFYQSTGQRHFERGEFDNACVYFRKMLPFNKISHIALSSLAVCAFRLGDENEAIRYTDELGKISKSNVVYIFNRAFFAIRNKNYASALHFYKELLRRKDEEVLQITLTSVVGFLDEEKKRHPEEYAYDFAIGFIYYHFLKKEVGKKELKSFHSAAMGKKPYEEMVRYVADMVFEGNGRQKRNGKKKK